MGSGGCCPLQCTALSLLWLAVTLCPGFFPAPFVPHLHTLGAMGRARSLSPAQQWEQLEGLCQLCHHGVTLQPWLGSAGTASVYWTTQNLAPQGGRDVLGWLSVPAP